jgi:hypothetical protein
MNGGIPTSCCKRYLEVSPISGSAEACAFARAVHEQLGALLKKNGGTEYAVVLLWSAGLRDFSRTATDVGGQGPAVRVPGSRLWSECSTQYMTGPARVESLPLMPGCSIEPRIVRRDSRAFAVRGSSCASAVKAKGTIFAIVYRRLVPRLGHAQATGAIANRLCRLIWKILHEGIRYEERGPAVSVEAKKVARDQGTWLRRPNS